MAPSTSNDHYIGFRVSLTSKSAIRYIGTLCSIDTKVSTVALKDVRSFGTEGRLRDGGPVMPSECIYPYIIFRASDILDLQVLSKPPAPNISASDIPGRDTSAQDILARNTPARDVPTSDVPTSDVPASDVPAPNIPVPATSSFSSALLSNASLAFPSTTTSLALPMSANSIDGVSNLSSGVPSYLPPTEPSSQMIPHSIEDLPIATPWTYGGFDNFDLGLTKPYTGASRNATSMLPKASKFAPLYPPTTAMMLPPYTREGKQSDGDAPRKTGGAVSDPFRNTSPFDANFSQGFGITRQFPHVDLNLSSTAASSSDRPVHSTGLSDRDAETRQVTNEQPIASGLKKVPSREKTQEKIKAEKAGLRREMQRQTPRQHSGNRVKVESDVKPTQTERAAVVRAPVPRAWGPPPIAAAPVQHSNKDDAASRSGDIPRQETAEGAKPSAQQPSTLRPNKGIVMNASERLRGSSYDRARRGGRRGRWDHMTRRREGRLIEVPNEDFNFEEMHEKLAAIQQEGGNEYPSVDPRYDKSKSFFDNLVPEKDVRAETSVSQQRAKDVETFGEAGAKAHNRRRGGGRNGHHTYRGRATRVRARGRGR